MKNFVISQLISSSENGRSGVGYGGRELSSIHCLNADGWVRFRRALYGCVVTARKSNLEQAVVLAR